jgi:hypothetical protein
VRALEKKRSTGRGLDDIEMRENDQNAEKLDKLWERVRSCLSERDDTGAIKTTNARKRFHDSCELKQAKYMGADTIKLTDVIQAFTAVRLDPLPTPKEFKELFVALEVFRDEDAETVVWSEILKALYSRDTVSVRGIFPKLVSLRAI